MIDNQFWKKAYIGRWEEGLKRSRIIIDKIQSWGFTTEEYGFLATSIEYNTNVPKEKGKPDWKIIIIPDKRFILLETTGTARSRPPDDVWIRNDKFEFAENHKDLDCWIGHIVENKNLIRFLKLENKEKFPFEKREIRGIIEKFRIIPENDSGLLSLEDFNKYLESLKELESNHYSFIK